jgi:hypothetical protein
MTPFFQKQAVFRIINAILFVVNIFKNHFIGSRNRVFEKNLKHFLEGSGIEIYLSKKSPFSEIRL